jgi:drug/metabolite transporter (DMT)-like permease
MCTIWGTTWLAIKVSLRYIPPLTGVGLRFLIAGALILLITRLLKRSYDWRRVPWNVVLVLAVFLFGLNYVLAYSAETRLDSGLVAVLFGTTPFFVFVFGGILIGEKAPARTWAGAALAVSGIYALTGSAQVRGYPLFVSMAVASAAMAAFALAYAKKYLRGSLLAIMSPAMLVAGIGVSVLAVRFEHAPKLNTALSAPSIAALAYLAILGSIVAFSLNLWLLRRMEAWRVGLSGLLIPVIALGVGIAFGGERPGWPELLGSGLVILGLCISLAMTARATQVGAVAPDNAVI